MTTNSKKRRPGPKSKVMTPAAKKRPGPKSMTNRRESKPATPKHNFSKEEVLKKLNKWKDPNTHKCGESSAMTFCDPNSILIIHATDILKENVNLISLCRRMCRRWLPI